MKKILWIVLFAAIGAVVAYLVRRTLERWEAGVRDTISRKYQNYRRRMQRKARKEAIKA